MKIKILFFLYNIWIVFLLHNYLVANQFDNFHLSGAYLGVFNSIQQKSLPDQ